MPLPSTDRPERPLVRLRPGCGRCGRYFAGSRCDHRRIALGFPHASDPRAFKAASNVFVAEEEAPRGPGCDSDLETASTRILLRRPGPLLQDRGPDLLNPLPHPPVGACLEYTDGPMGARTGGFRP